MKDKKIVTLRSAPPVSVEVPSVVKGDDGKERKVERSCFGALRLFPGLPKAVTEDELEHIKNTEPGMFARLVIQPYVESKRVDVRGVTESEVEKMAEEEGISHLKPKERDKKLRERGKLKRPEKRKAAKPEPSKAPEKPTSVKRKPNGNKPSG